MPSDVLGSTRTTMIVLASFSVEVEFNTPSFNGYGKLQSLNKSGIKDCKFLMNKEFLVIVNHHFPMITSLNFVHTARRSYQLNKKIKSMELPRIKIA
jgi:hypothetical protein